VEAALALNYCEPDKKKKKSSHKNDKEGIEKNDTESGAGNGGVSYIVWVNKICF